VIRHLLKLVWARKRANALLIIEIFFSFIVVFAVVTMAASMIMRWNKPLGFDYRDVWVADVTFPAGAADDDSVAAARRVAVAAMVHEVKGQPQVESVAAAGAAPYNT
jgi:putative ABC transport system permease protein